jgi:nitrate reductase (NAD(P)H)
MNTQPAMITWNVMGMMNNCHFRVLIHPHTDEQGNIGVRFQHPAPVEVGGQTVRQTVVLAQGTCAYL